MKLILNLSIIRICLSLNKSPLILSFKNIGPGLYLKVDKSHSKYYFQSDNNEIEIPVLSFQ